MKRRWFIAIAAGILYVAMLCATWDVATQRAKRQTESMLDYALLDLDSTLNGSIDTMLMHVAKSIVEELGRPSAFDQAYMSRLAVQHDVDEINVVDRTGRNLASNDQTLVGVDFTDKSESAKFMVLIEGKRPALSQPFRAGAHNPDVRRKYVGVPFPDGEGFVQVGVDESRLIRMFPAIMGFIFDGWLLGEHGFFLCADIEDGHLISNPARHRDEAKFLAETGYDPSAPWVKEDGKTTFRHRLFGDFCDCRATIFCGHRIIAALPPAEYYTTRTLYTLVMAVVLAFVMTLFVLLLWRIDADTARLQAFYAEQAKQQAAELELGQIIQMSVLPSDFPVSEHFRLAASMTPAREVGGDFYDFFALDDTHQAFLVADVSGKGVTGALYMMNARTLIKDTLLAEPTFNPATALKQVNLELCRSNPAEMFITAWVGVLDLETGRIAYANAGHNPPLHLRNNELPEWIRERSGCPLACFEKVNYRVFETTLAPGEMLFLYTDGVTEAMDSTGALYGDARLHTTLVGATAGDPAGITPDGLVQTVRNSVKLFADDAPQADDLTVLAVQYLGAVERYMRTFSCNDKAVANTSEYLTEMLEKNCKCSEAEKAQLLIALDEVVSNVVRCSGASGVALEVRFSRAPRGVMVSVSDDGKPFNPLYVPEPDTKAPLEERTPGGLGILLLRKTMDDLNYRYAHGCNILTFRKNFA
ncbi:MAG: SpoIIE family protein phosphatase [Victivallales bacterium]|nr:SpoIIE family protein phosphatase [Victivallales bacterium]